jgi:toxin ParE1/3/4
MRIRWLSRALGHIEMIHCYIGERDPAAADRVVARIHQAVLRLASHPHIGRPGPRPDTRELVVTGTRYIVTYRIREQTVEILTVVHHARHPSQRW